MKWLATIMLVLSLALNGYFIFDEIRFSYRQEYGRILNRTIGGELSKTTWKEGLEIFAAKVKEKDSLLLNKKYYYINVWTSFCAPCIREMPWLDSLAGGLHKDVSYFFVTDMNDAVANRFIERTKYKVRNFVFLNDMNDFVSAICNEKGTRSKIYPMVLILSNKGELLHSSNGAYSNKREAAGFAELINKLE